MYPRITFENIIETFSGKDWELAERISKAAAQIPKEMWENLQENPVDRMKSKDIEWQEDDSHSLSEIRDFWIKVKSIQKAANLCVKEDRSEDSWSDDVILEIMKLALGWSGLGEKLIIANL